MSEQSGIAGGESGPGRAERKLVKNWCGDDCPYTVHDEWRPKPQACQAEMEDAVICAATALSAMVDIACVCGRHFVGLFRPPDWKARCPACAALCTLTITVALEVR